MAFFLLQWTLIPWIKGEKMMLTPGKLLTEGKGKRVYATEDPDKAIVYFKDEAMA